VPGSRRGRPPSMSAGLANRPKAVTSLTGFDYTRTALGLRTRVFESQPDTEAGLSGRLSGHRSHPPRICGGEKLVSGSHIAGPISALSIGMCSTWVYSLSYTRYAVE